MSDADGEAGAEGGEFVRALARGLAVIEAFGATHTPMTLSQVAKRADVTRATARRLLHTLCALGYVAFDGKLFSLRPKVLNLGLAYLSSLTLTGVAQPFMQELVGRVQESCSISVLDGTDIVYVVRVPMKRIMSIEISIGTRLPAARTSMGRVLLSALPDADLDAILAATPDIKADAVKAAVRQAGGQGWALVNQELEEGLRSIAVPIRGRGGMIIAAMNVSTHASRVTEAQLEGQFLSALQQTAEGISRALLFG
ncbi:IclR family transcriptional regulator domain-containing protein [Nitrospirillum amazonense]|uniref:IclR family transcriptional regulator n=1 Tax=Nitrospirillum amazonense TaxID=28077 RepID=A0A560JIW4_9PROT|nr:IclR family transcriptional regulator C-terminal domain-containing protein [Nitrospirillum amazonense]MDG3438873.1 IclR family transcriptional regulator C-terminal domain-containing protein [Nitrospirillum amazonense]TWB69324.1 IclR family transcriptional regulator [Nitrospirillum amazonense]